MLQILNRYNIILQIFNKFKHNAYAVQHSLGCCSLHGMVQMQQNTKNKLGGKKKEKERNRKEKQITSSSKHKRGLMLTSRVVYQFEYTNTCSWQICFNLIFKFLLIFLVTSGQSVIECNIQHMQQDPEITLTHISSVHSDTQNLSRNFQQHQSN